jgi:hypothetical protein
MRHLILVSKTPIVIQIFTLVCKKLNIRLEVLNQPQIDHKVDIIVIDKEFIDDRFSIFKTYSKRIGAITNEKLSFDTANDFVIPSPFLPSTLEVTLEEQIQEIVKKQSAKTYVSNIEVEDEDFPLYEEKGFKDKERDPAIDYLDSLAGNIASDLEEENDESVVNFTSLEESKGGILDNNELSRLEDMINPQNDIDSITEDVSADNEDSQEWLDLADIIDQAIDEVNINNDYYSKEENKPIKLLLNNYSMQELTPLLNLLNQELIDSLADGQEITLQLKLGNDNEQQPE